MPTSSGIAIAPPPHATPAASSSARGATTPSASASAPPPPALPPDAIELAVGEAILLPGTLVPTNLAGPRTVDTMTFSNREIVVIAATEGDSSLTLDDGRGQKTTKHFHVVSTLCRPQPLHPAVILGEGDRAVWPAGGATQVEITRHLEKWIVSASATKSGKISALGQNTGHASVIVVKADRSVVLFDVFVGNACRDKGYTSIATALPPGTVGPKGDGTCVRTHEGKASPAPCPDPAKAAALDDEDLSPIACDWASSCDVQGFEGCCIGCTSPFPMKIKRACALRTLRMKTCAEVKKELMSPACVR